MANKQTHGLEGSFRGRAKHKELGKACLEKRKGQCGVVAQRKVEF